MSPIPVASSTPNHPESSPSRNRNLGLQTTTQNSTPKGRSVLVPTGASTVTINGKGQLFFPQNEIEAKEPLQKSSVAPSPASSSNSRNLNSELITNSTSDGNSSPSSSENTDSNLNKEYVQEETSSNSNSDSPLHVSADSSVSSEKSDPKSE